MNRSVLLAFLLGMVFAGIGHAGLGIQLQADRVVLSFPSQTLADPIGCVYIGNRFLTRLSPQDLSAGKAQILLSELEGGIQEAGRFPLRVFTEGSQGGKFLRADAAGTFARRPGGQGYDYVGEAVPDEALNQLIAQRFQELRDIRARIVAQHAEWTADLNPVFMLSDNDRKQMLGLVVPPDAGKDLPRRPFIPTPVPDSLDWTNVGGQNYVTAVTNQGGCGSCWAFAAVAQVEALVNVAENKPSIGLDLSEQDVVSCDRYDGGCNGGWPETALTFIRDNGIPTESCFPYQGSNVACNPCSNWLAQARKINTVSVVTTQSQEDARTMNALVNHPVSSCVYVDGSFDAYSGGIYSYTGPKETLPNHAILLVGWGGGTTQPYWKLKNSWGTSWGENGFMRARRDQGNTLGWYTTDATYRPLYVDAGNDTAIHPRDTVSLKPTVRDGAPCYDTTRAAYTYAWSPRTGLSDSTLKNPRAYPTATTTYHLTVKDLNTSKTDSIRITVTSSDGPYIALSGYASSPTPLPGATVSVVDTLANLGLGSLTNTQAKLRTTSTYAHLTDSTYAYGTIAAGAKANNGSSPFLFQVDNATPQNTNAAFTVNVAGDSNGGTYQRNLPFALLLNPHFPDTNGTDFYIMGDGDNSSGIIADSLLLALGYSGKFYNDVTFVGYPAIAPYHSVWVFVPGLSGADSGFADTSYTLMRTGSSDETQMVNYLNAGGRMYFQDPNLGWACSVGHNLQNLYPLFHIASYSNYSGNMAREVGTTGYFAQGMNFSYNPLDTATNGGNDLDALTPGTGAFSLFTSQTAGQHHVIAYPSGTYRTLASTMVFAGLHDSLAPSTKEVYADSIMHWFGVYPSGAEQGIAFSKTLPHAYELGAARPNPMTRSAAISFALPRESKASLKVYNIAGQLVSTLVDGQLPAGYHEARWDGRNLPSGVYFFRLEAGSFRATRKLVMVR